MMWIRTKGFTYADANTLLNPDRTNAMPWDWWTLNQLELMRFAFVDWLNLRKMASAVVFILFVASSIPFERKT